MEGQQRLKAARVLCVGTGGLGSPLAFYLAAAGIGTLGLVDFDVVDASNLQRQIIHSTKDIGRKKLDSAEEKLMALNPALNVVKHETMLTSANALEILKDYDIVADGTDNFPTRYLVNDACVLLGKPNAYGSIFRFEGQASVFATEEGPCYRCLYPEPPPPGLVPSCAEGGVLGILPGLVGVIQATEVIKLILGKGARQGTDQALFLSAFEALTGAYLAGVDWEDVDDIEARAASLLPALFLARVDGKSPVEYLSHENERAAVRRCAVPLIAEPPARLEQVAEAWRRAK